MQSINNSNKIKEIINEEILYNSLCFLPFEVLLDSLISIGYENDIDTIGNSKTSVLNRLVNDVRELGIEDFIQRLNFDTVTETCSLLSLSGVNGDNDEEILKKSRQQLEDKMKKDSLDQFFFSLTPHILYQFCNCLKIILPPPTEGDKEELPQDEQQPPQQQQQQQQNEESTTDKATTKIKTISNSIPSIKVGSDGTTVLSTLSTKSSFKKFLNNRGIQYGDSIVEGLFYENIIRLVKEEIIVSGTENLFSFLSKAKLYTICEHLKITSIKQNDKMSEIITKIVSKLFNIDNNPQAAVTPIITTAINSNTKPSFTTPIKSNKEYPQTPISPDDNDNDINNNNNNNNNNKSESDSDSGSDEITEVRSTITKKNKRKYEDVNDDDDNNNNDGGDDNESNKEASIKSVNDNTEDPIFVSETDDSEVDQPAKRPSIIDIKMGIKKQDLEAYLVKDLRSWLQNKGLKYNDKKTILINRILKYLENDADATSASESESSVLEGNNNGKRISKRQKLLNKQQEEQKQKEEQEEQEQEEQEQEGQNE